MPPHSEANSSPDTSETSPTADTTADSEENTTPDSQAGDPDMASDGTDHPENDGSQPSMERITVRFPKQQTKDMEKYVEAGHFPSRSELVRAGVRQLLNRQRRQQQSDSDR